MTTAQPVTGSIPVVRGTVLTVVVTRGTTPWLPATLEALAAQTRTPTGVLVVDAAPRPTPDVGPLPAGDPVTRLVTSVLGEQSAVRTVAVPGARTFGEAVRDALALPDVGVPPRAGAADLPTGAAGDRPAPGTGPTAVAAGRPGDAGDWLWLLHDDSAPEPTALAELVRAVEHAPSVGLAGVKQRSWDDATRLLEVGLTTSRLGRRMTGVEDGEVDQGQHDGREDVLGVGLAGALVRRDVWDELGGPDPALGPFGDGLDLSRRARLAGYRVVVVPRAVVRHAQASYAGLRDDDLLHVLTGAAPHDHDAPGPVGARAVGQPAPRPADPRRSFAARRRAHVHARLAAVPLVLLPVQTVVFLVAAVLRSLARIAAKDGMLAAAELAAPVVAVLHPARMARSRAAARRARRLPRRSLRALQSSWRDVVREERDRALARGEVRRVVQAPSELEIAELAALAGRRRAGLGVLVVALAGLTLAALGPLVGAVLGGARLVGGGLLPVGGDLGDLWRALTQGWIPAGLGTPAPADPLLGVLVPVAALVGGPQGAVHLLFLGGLALAGLSAWSAAGAATRSVALRLWAAVVWTAAPSLLLALDDGRLGAVVAHAALPWVALGVARALGVQRTDVVVPGLVDARTDAGASDAPAVDTADEPRVAAGATAMVVAGASTADGVPVPHVVSAAPVGPAGHGSVTAAAAAGLALAVAVAGAPVLLPAALLALVGVALAARRGRRRLLLVALPALAVAGPWIAEAVERAEDDGWRVLLAEPGRPVASAPAPGWQQLLAWPTPPRTDLARLVGADVAAVLPFALGGAVVVLALVALVRGATVVRGVRAGWLVAACGLAAAALAGRVDTAVVDGTVVRGWPGAAVSLALLGLLVAATLGADGTRGRMARRTFGWRQVTVVGLAVVAALAPLVPLAEWTVRAGTGSGASAVRALSGPVVPAVGQQVQTSPARSRVLALDVAEDGEVGYALLRGDGPQATERSAAAAARDLTPADGAGAATGVTRTAGDDVAAGGSGAAGEDGTTGDAGPLGLPGAGVPRPADAATAELGGLVARIATGAAGDLSADLGALGVGAVLVPPTDDDEARVARAALVGRLDSTGGLERITENPTGVIWRVVAAPGAGAGASAGAADAATADEGGGPVTAWARLVDAGGTGAPAAGAGPAGTEVTPLPAGPLSVDTRVPAGGDDRRVVLAERADDGWRAWLDGRPLAAVEDGWRQAFALGADGGRLTVAHVPAGRTMWWTLQGVVLGLTLLLALPVRRRRGGPR